MSLPLLRVRNQFIYACSCFFFFSSRRRHTRCSRDWSSDVCSSDLTISVADIFYCVPARRKFLKSDSTELGHIASLVTHYALANPGKQFILTTPTQEIDRKSTRLNSSHGYISYAVFCLKKKT